MYVALRKDDIRKSYRSVKESLTKRFEVEPNPSDIISVNPAVMGGIDDTTGLVCVYGSLVLPPFRKWFQNYDDVTLISDEMAYLRPDLKFAKGTGAKSFSPDTLIYGKVNQIESIDDDLLLRTFGIDPDIHGQVIGKSNIRNLLRVGQNGSFKEDGLYTLLVNEDLMREALLKRERKTA